MAKRREKYRLANAGSIPVPAPNVQKEPSNRGSFLLQGISQYNQERKAINIETNKLHNIDCLEGMKLLPSESIDMVLTDLPYGTTHCKWDNIIPFEPLWEQYKRVIKPRGALVFTAAQPFTTSLISSNRRMFRYCWYWVKNQATGFPFSKHQPLRCVEDIVVFYKQTPVYNPQGIVKLDYPIKKKGKSITGGVYRENSLGKTTYSEYTNYPKNVIKIKCERGLHPTQKPVELFEYLIKTYTKPGEIVLDTCMGSGTTAIACINTGRQFVGFETDAQYYKIASRRIEEMQQR